MSNLQHSASDTESFAALFEQSLADQNMRTGEVISAEVVRIEHSFVIVDAGLKSEAYIPIEEFLNDQGELEVQVGDFVSVAIDALENGYGDTVLSRDKAKRLASWLALEKALENNELVSGTITGKVKGGMTVMVDGVRAFLPGSLIDARPAAKDIAQVQSQYEGKTLTFRVIKLDRKRNNVVLSRRAVIEAEQSEEREKLLETLQENEIVEGIVKNITSYGAFVELASGAIDGLLHITDIAWRRLQHPSELLSIGQKIITKVLKFDRVKKRVSLGMKQLSGDPWEGIAKRYPAGTRLFGKVTNITDYGAFVEIEPDSGIEGLVHISAMDWTNKNAAPSKVVQLDQEIEVMVLSIDEQRRRISLGRKQCQPNPWDDFNHHFKKGDKVSGAIRSITDFGMFIGLPGDIDGLVYLSDLSWNEPGEEVIHKYKKGDTIEAVVLGIDVDKERISLGIKQLEHDPFHQYVDKYEKGALVQGKVKSVDSKGAYVTLANEVEGYLRSSEMSGDHVEGAHHLLKEGDIVTVTMMSADHKSHRIYLSMKEVERQHLSSKKNETDFGALLKAELGGQKQKEQEEKEEEKEKEGEGEEQAQREEQGQEKDLA